MRMIDLHNELTEIEVLPPAARTASANGAAIDLQGYVGKVKAILDSGAGGAGTTMDIKIQDCDTSGGAYADVSGLAFTQVGNAASVQAIAIDTRSVKRFIRAAITIAGTTPSFTSAIIAVGQKQSS